MSEAFDSDHDLLIRIDANLVAFNKAFQEHLIQDAKEFGKLEMAINAAHKRLDPVIGVFILLGWVVKALGLISLVIGIILGLQKIGLL